VPVAGETTGGTSCTPYRVDVKWIWADTICGITEARRRQRDRKDDGFKAVSSRAHGGLGFAGFGGNGYTDSQQYIE
jgi:hypothetical protein